MRPLSWLGRAFGIYACVAIASTPSAAQHAPVMPLSIDDALATHTFEPTSAIELSPGGRYLAYTLTNPERPRARDARDTVHGAHGVPDGLEGTGVWVLDTKTGVSTNVSGDARSSWGPSWSPDGKYLAFVSDRDGVVRSWVWDRRSARLVRVSERPVRTLSGFDAPRWLPSGSALIAKLAPHGTTVAQSATGDTARSEGRTGATVIVYRSAPNADDTATGLSISNDASATSRFVSDMAVVQVPSGTIRTLVRDQPVVMFDASPDGAHISYTTFAGTGTASQQNHYDLNVVSPTDGHVRTIARRVPQAMGLNMSWSPDGGRLAYCGSNYGAVSNTPTVGGQCFVWRVGDSTSTSITEGEHPDFGSAFRRPTWSEEGDRIFLAAGGELWSASTAGGAPRRVAVTPNRRITEIIQQWNGRSVLPGRAPRDLLVATFDTATKRSGFARVDLGSGLVRQLVDEERSYASLPRAVAAAGGVVYYVAEDAAHAQDLWRADSSFTDRHPVTHVNPQLDAYEFGQPRLVHWLNDEGRTLSGALLLPAGYQAGHTYPLALSLYGGATQSNDVYRFGGTSLVLANDQLLATRGYAVFSPDIPLRIGTPMRDIAADVLPGVNKIVDLGIANPDQLVAMGSSYGGYSVLALLTVTSRFKAAVSMSGLSDLFSFYATLTPNDLALSTGWAEQGQGRMGGSPWQFRDRYVENSPFFYLDRVQTPVLLVHGTMDTAVPATLGDQTFVALRRLGKEATYLRYVGEGHGIADPRNVRDFTNRVIGWFDEHIAPPDQPAHAKEHVHP